MPIRPSGIEARLPGGTWIAKRLIARVVLVLIGGLLHLIFNAASPAVSNSSRGAQPEHSRVRGDYSDTLLDHYQALRRLAGTMYIA